ncbi:hypothetical protein D9M68_906500 [compost metagenome]
MQRTGTQLPIAGVERALVGVVLDATEQVVVRRVRFEDHGGAATRMVTDHQAGAVLLFQHLAGLRVGFFHLDQLIDHRLQQVDLDRLEIATDAGIFRVFLRQRRQQWLQGHGDGLFV